MLMLSTKVVPNETIKAANQANNGNFSGCFCGGITMLLVVGLLIISVFPDPSNIHGCGCIFSELIFNFC